MHDPMDGRAFNIGRVKGRHVIDSNGDNVGTVEDLVVDPATWRVSGFVVTLRRDIAQRFNLKSSLFEGQRVELGSERVRTIGDNVMLNIGIDLIGETLRRRDPMETTGSLFEGEPPAGPPSFEPPMP